MNIEDKIRKERNAFDDRTLPEGHRERFMSALLSSQTMENRRHINKKRTLLLTVNAVAAACLAIAIVIANVDLKVTDSMPSQTAENKLLEMRKIYDDKVYEAVANLETVMASVDDTTKMHIDLVIGELLNMSDVFAEIAPLPEDRQMAIAEKIYDTKLKTIELITEKINK
ncbi:MAG: hypothetical protein ACI358_05890 [Candidatus Limimorpha sp.]